MMNSSRSHNKEGLYKRESGRRLEVPKEAGQNFFKDRVEAKSLRKELNVGLLAQERVKEAHRRRKRQKRRLLSLPFPFEENILGPSILSKKSFENSLKIAYRAQKALRPKGYFYTDLKYASKAIKGIGAPKRSNSEDIKAYIRARLRREMGIRLNISQAIEESSQSLLRFQRSKDPGK